MRLRMFSTLFLLMDVTVTARRPTVAEQGEKARRGDKATGRRGERISRPVARSPRRPVASSIIFRHRVSDASCQNSFDRVSRQRQYLGERVTIFFWEF